MKSRTHSARPAAGRAFTLFFAVTLLSFNVRAANAQASEPAAAADAGILQGRIANLATGEYIGNARVSVEHTALETTTNDYGEYILTNLPAGPVTVHVEISGYVAQSATATVVPGQTVSLNLNLALALGEPKARKGEEVVTLDKFVVAAGKEMSGSSIAINERQTAPNLMDVISADQFGDTLEGNVAELAKLLPGVTVDYTGADARFIDVRGMPSFGTVVLLDGNRVATASLSFSRATEFDSLSLNNLARIEVIKSPTPDLPADMIGGAVNMERKDAFERSTPILGFRLDLSGDLDNGTGVNYLTLHHTPGPGQSPIPKAIPGGDFTYIVPVSDRFGFTISAMSANQFEPEARSADVWQPTSSASALAPGNAPYLDLYKVSDDPKVIWRTSAGISLDFRPASHDVVSFAAQWNRFDTTSPGNDLFGQVNGSSSVAPASYGPAFVDGAANAGAVTLDSTGQRKIAVDRNLSFSYHHNGPVWKSALGAAYSNGITQFRNTEDGYFTQVTLTIPKVTINFNNIANGKPVGTPMQVLSNGSQLDTSVLSNYTISSATSTPNIQRSTTSSAYANASRSFDGTMPLQLKVGVDVRREDRDFRGQSNSWSFVGPDGVAGTADDKASNYNLLYNTYQGVPLPFGFGYQQWPSPYKAFALYQANPSYFVLNQASAYSGAVTQSRKMTEDVAAGYVRADVDLFNNRLKLVGGVRFEETSDNGYGSLTSIANTYEKDANGNILLVSGKPVQLPGLSALQLAQLEFVDRGDHVGHRYGNPYPSLNAIYHISEKLMARASYALTITRPQLSNIVPGTTVSDPTVTTTQPTITVSNTDLKPWTSNNYDVALEYYFDKPGIISFGAFQKDIKNFFGSVSTPATAALLSNYGLDPSLLNDNYNIVTLANVGTAKVTGMEFDYSQVLSVGPGWLRDFSVFANGTVLHLEGASTADFSTFIRRSINWGLAWTKPRYTVRLNWNFRGRERGAVLTGVNVPPGTYAYTDPQVRLDVNFDWRLTKRLGLFLNVRNVTDSVVQTETYGPATPAYARKTLWDEFGPLGEAGIKGTF